MPMRSVNFAHNVFPVIPDTPVERRPASGLPYETFLRDYVARNRPVVVEGAASAWPAIRKWTPEFFKTRFGSRRVDVNYQEQMPFADFIDAVNLEVDRGQRMTDAYRSHGDRSDKSSDARSAAQEAFAPACRTSILRVSSA